MQVKLDVEAVRARFSALRRPYAFFDGPAGTQVPDEVIDAIAGYLRDSNANVGGQFETSRRTGLSSSVLRIQFSGSPERQRYASPSCSPNQPWAPESRHHWSGTA